MDELGMDKTNYEWYLNLRKFGGVEHAGYGLGFERMIMYLTGIQNIRDVLPFPPHRLRFLRIKFNPLSQSLTALPAPPKGGAFITLPKDA